MTTPTIRWLHEKHNKPIDVNFNTQYVKDCFIDCSFINHVNSCSKWHVSSGMINAVMPDYKYIFKRITGQEWSDKYHTYIDTCDEFTQRKDKFLLILNGLAGTSWKGKKEIPQHIHKYIAEHSPHKIVFTGSQTDLNVSTPWIKDIAEEIHVNDIRKSLSLVRDASCIISNDTGLAHASAAMNKHILILWKDTPFIKNQNPGKNTVYAQKNEWTERIKEFLNEK